MKKYMILAAAAAMTLASCAKFETIDVNYNDEDAVIGFTNYAPRSLSKAGSSYVAGNALADGAQFAVYGWSTAYGNFLGVNPGTPAFMNPAVVTYHEDTDDGVDNTYTPTRYWPSGDTPANLSFTAYYPYGGAGITAPTFSTGVGTYAFEAQSAATDMVDFCVADVVNDQTYGHTNKSGQDGTVDFTFKHQLTKVQFKFKTGTLATGTTINLVDAKLYNVKTKGTLTATYAQNASPAVNALGTTTTTWSAQATATTAVVYDVTLNQQDPSNSNKLPLSTTASTVHNNDIFLMVPQTMVAPTFTTTPNIPANLSSAAQYLLVTWEVVTGGVTTTNVKALYLDQCVTEDNGSTQANIDWEKNNFITYTVTIGPKPIYFTASVTAWDSEQNGYFNVN